MKLALLTLDRPVTIYQGKDLGGGTTRQDLHESSFAADDGWDITLLRDGIFSLHREGMPFPVTVGAYGYSYQPTPVVVAKGKK